MMSRLSAFRPRRATNCLLAGAAVLLAGPAGAQSTLYKITEPDGRITYTDRPVTNTTGRVSPVSGNGVAGAPIDDSIATLPLALRSVATRFPVTLYTATDCVPCDRGREYLRQRGVPFRERLASTDADREAWQRVVGAPEAPAVSIGTQMLRGFAPDTWGEYLDVAGYPRDGRLPPNYQPPPVGPVAQARPGSSGTTAAEGAASGAAPAAPSIGLPSPPPAATDTGVPVPAIRF